MIGLVDLWIGLVPVKLTHILLIMSEDKFYLIFKNDRIYSSKRYSSREKAIENINDNDAHVLEFTVESLIKHKIEMYEILKKLRQDLERVDIVFLEINKDKSKSKIIAK